MHASRRANIVPLLIAVLSLLVTTDGASAAGVPRPSPTPSETVLATGATHLGTEGVRTPDKRYSLKVKQAHGGDSLVEDVGKAFIWGPDPHVPRMTRPPPPQEPGACAGGFAGRLSASDGVSYADPGPVIAVQTGQDGVALAELAVTFAPGDNFRVAASQVEGYLDTLVDGDVPHGQGPELPEQEPGVENQNGKLSETLTVWRQLYVDVDHLSPPIVDPPPGDGPFLGAGIGDADDVGGDDQYPFPHPMSYLSTLAEVMGDAYVQVVALDDFLPGVLGLDPDIDFRHNAAVLSDTDGIIEWATLSQPDARVTEPFSSFWAIQVVVGYEPDISDDNDPDYVPGDPDSIIPLTGIAPGVDPFVPKARPSFVFAETVRDFYTWTGASFQQAPIVCYEGYLRRSLLHEAVHRFGLVHQSATGIGDEGPMVQLVNLIEDSIQVLRLTPRQLNHVRTKSHPM